MIVSFQYKKEVRVDNLMHCFFKMSASKFQRRSGLKSWDTQNMIQPIKAVCNKEMGYLATAKIITCLVLHYTITFAQIGNPFQATQSKLGRKPIIPPALEEKLVDYLLLFERKYFGCTRDDVRRLDFQIPVQNKIPNPFSIFKEAAGKEWFKRCMKRYSDRLSLRQPAGTSTTRATGFSKEQVNFLWFVRKMASSSWLPTFTYFQSRRNWVNSGSKDNKQKSSHSETNVRLALTAGWRGSLLKIVV